MTQKNTSQYLDTPIRDFYLDLLNLRRIPPSDNDTLFTITPDIEKRPDLLAAKQYGTPRLWWVFAVRNPDELIDPIEDFVAGLEIFIPSLDNIKEIR